MARSAIGLIETQGLVGVTDTAAKAADVQLLGIERIGGGGQPSERGGRRTRHPPASRRCGEDVESRRLPGSVSMTSAEAGPESGPPDPSDASERDVSEPDAADLAKAESLPDLQHLSPSDLGRLSVARLRQLARRTPGVRLRGREISRAKKEELVAQLLAAAGRESGQ